MKKLTTIFGLVFFSQFFIAQITTTKIAEIKEEVSNEPYDSTLNFVGDDVYKYIGQELYLKGKAESLRKYGYEDFFTDFTTTRDNVYKCCDSYNSKYDDLAGKYFSVIDVHKHPKAEKGSYYAEKYYLELREKESDDKVYYEYDSKSSEYFFPFVVAGYFVKQKESNFNREFVVRGENWISDEPMADMITGQPVAFEVGSKWKCIDLTIEEKYFTLSMILQNAKGEKIPISLDNAVDTRWVFLAEDAKRHKMAFGGENWTKILNGKIEIGFTEEMVLLSWGKPENINEASYGDQWIYGGQYLYFENGKLKAFN